MITRALVHMVVLTLLHGLLLSEQLSEEALPGSSE